MREDGSGSALIKIFLLLCLLLPNVSSLAVEMRKPRVYPYGWERYFEAAEWMRDNTPESAVVGTRKPMLFHILSGRKTFLYAWADPDSVVAHLRENGATHVVAENIGYTATSRYLVPAMEAHPKEFWVKWGKEAPQTLVLEVRHGK